MTWSRSFSVHFYEEGSETRCEQQNVNDQESSKQVYNVHYSLTHSMLRQITCDIPDHMFNEHINVNAARNKEYLSQTVDERD